MFTNLLATLIFIAIIGVLPVTAAYSANSLSSKNQAVDKANLFHHHIHNFYLNDSDKSNPNYLVTQSHALAMSYDATTHYLTNKLPGEMDSLKRILLHSAYYIPFSIDFDKHEVKYTVSYLDANNRSTVNPERIVWRSYPMDSTDIELLQGYGCASSRDYMSISTTSTLDDANKLYRIDKVFKRVIVNWQSKFVVEDLVKKTIQSLQIGRYDYLFFDDLPRNPGECLNKDYGGKGHYSSWKEGQLAFLKTVTETVHAMHGRLGLPIKVFGNIWSPYADADTAKWYANKTLRLDHYYFESGGYSRQDLLYGQAANGTDPETGLPAFVLNSGGYIPANLMSLGTKIPSMYALVRDATSEGAEDYLMQHYKAAGIGATQGSWFGWYGETSVNKTNSEGKLIHTNAMQLLRAIPNWENLAVVPLAMRKYDKLKNIYTSPRSKFSNNVIQGWNPVNNEIYAVFRTTTGQMDLLGKTVVSIKFVDDYFNKTDEDARSCVGISNNLMTLKCANKTEKGMRITIQ